MRALTILMMLPLAACGVVGGPSGSKIEEIARQQMIAAQPDPALIASAKAAKINAKGLCNTQAEPGVHVCMVDVTAKLPGQASEATQTMVVKLKKGANGDWVSAE